MPRSRRLLHHPPRSTTTRSAICATTPDRGDVQRRRVKLPHHIERAQHLDLRGHVQRGRRLVQDHQLRSVISAIAAISRCNWPPETWCGKRAPIARDREAPARGTADRLRLRRARFISPWISARSDHLRHDPPRRIEGRRRALRDVADLAATEPEEGAPGKPEHVGIADRTFRGDAAAPARMAHQRSAIVVLPEPDSPISAATSPRPIVKLTPSTDRAARP